MDPITTQMEPCIKVSGRMINLMDAVGRHGQMVLCMKGSIKVVRRMDEVNSSGKMGHIMKVNSWIII